MQIKYAKKKVNITMNGIPRTKTVSRFFMPFFKKEVGGWRYSE